MIDTVIYSHQNAPKHAQNILSTCYQQVSLVRSLAIDVCVMKILSVLLCLQCVSFLLQTRSKQLNIFVCERNIEVHVYRHLLILFFQFFFLLLQRAQNQNHLVRLFTVFFIRKYE